MKRTVIVAVALALGIGTVIANAQAPAPPSRPSRRSARPATRRNRTPSRASSKTSRSRARRSSSRSTRIPRSSGSIRRRSRSSTAAKPRPADALRDIAKNREARIDYVEKDGAKVATQISFKGPIKIAPDKLVELRRGRASGRAGAREGRLHADRLAAAAARAGRHDPDRDQPALPGVRQVRRPAAEGQEPAHRLLLPGRHLHDEPELDAARPRRWATRTSRCIARAIPSGSRGTSASSPPPHLKEAWIDKEIPHVLVDARPASTAAEGSIPGAVSIPPSDRCVRP